MEGREAGERRGSQRGRGDSERRSEREGRKPERAEGGGQRGCRERVKEGRESERGPRHEAYETRWNETLKVLRRRVNVQRSTFNDELAFPYEHSSG
jgi:hypothetical protein